MGPNPQQNFEEFQPQPPKFNIDKLEGAVMHFLQVCGPLSGAAINAFSQHYAYERNKRLPDNYGTQSLLPRMLRGRKAFRLPNNLYSLTPFAPFDESARQRLDAFWTFLENMEGVDIATVIPGPMPAQISYLKNNKIYHIICCKDDGKAEMMLAMSIEEMMRQRMKTISEDERFIIMYKNKWYLENAIPCLHAKTLLGTVEYPNESDTPSISFALAQK